MFAAGQRVRLKSAYSGKSLTYRPHHGIERDKAVRTLPAGTEFTVSNRRKSSFNVGVRLDGPTVLVKNADGIWCIPERLLEAVDKPQPTDGESNGDAASDRVG